MKAMVTFTDPRVVVDLVGTAEELAEVLAAVVPGVPKVRVDQLEVDIAAVRSSICADREYVRSPPPAPSKRIG